MMMHSQWSCSGLLLVCAAWVGGCGSDDASPGGSGPGDAGTVDGAEAGDVATPDTGSEAEVGEDANEPDGVADAVPDVVGEDVTEPDAAVVYADEQEPNDGATLEEYNDLGLDVWMRGAVGTVGDSDVFRVQSTAGKVLRVALELPVGSALEPHVAVFDDGRGTAAAGEDYVKVAAGTNVVIEWLAMDTAGYFVAIRDARNVSAATVGGAEFTYSLQATEHDTDGYEGQPLVFPSQFDDALPHASGLRLYGFQGAQGADILVDLQAKGDMDGRLMIYADAIDSWIARNDDRGAQDPNPLIDAFLTEGGAMFLVVENIDEGATDLSYSIDATLP